VVVLPATSVHAPVTSRSKPSPAEWDVVVQCAGAIPDPNPSDQCQATVTSLLCQPFALAAGDCVGVATGPSSSILTSWDARAVFPARSVQLAVRMNLPSAGGLDDCVQCAGSRPEPSRSDQCQSTRTSSLFHPAELA